MIIIMLTVIVATAELSLVYTEDNRADRWWCRLLLREHRVKVEMVISCWPMVVAEKGIILVKYGVPGSWLSGSVSQRWDGAGRCQQRDADSCQGDELFGGCAILHTRYLVDTDW